MKRRLVFSIIALFMVVISSRSLSAQSSADPIAVMGQANQAYENGQFEQAAQLYALLVGEGFEDGVLYYNLGNAYFKQEDWGRAILNYRRAQQLLPRDPDIRDNLLLAQAQTVDQLEGQGTDLLSQAFKFSRRWLTLNEMALAALGLWFVLILLIIVSVRVRHERLKQWVVYATIVVGLLFVGGLFSLGGRLYVEHVQPEAVVVVEEIDVMSGPGEQYIKEFTLHNGTEVSLLETRPRWVRLMLPGGQLQGWAPVSAVEEIVVK